MNNAVFTILAVDDDVSQLELLRVFMEDLSFPEVEFLSAQSAEEALDIIPGHIIDLVLTDYRLPGKSGLDLLEDIKAKNPLISVVVMTAYESASDAVNILKHGGDDYLLKPTRKEDIEHLVLRIFEQKSIERENLKIDDEIRSSFDGIPVVYKSDSMKAVLNIVARSSESDATVLITGESGTGKELVARLVHQAGLRRAKPFVTVNLAALPETLIDSELFGHVKGAFTGAERDRIGRFEEADGGTVFIDEIGDVPLAVQVKLLRIIQFGQIQRLGENLTRNTDVRIIAATNRDLNAMIAEKNFRADLYWRLNVISIDLPPLRRRKEDIPRLVRYFINKYNEKNHREIRGLSREALDILMEYSFPGNIRELENMMERAVVLCRGSLVSRDDLPILIHSSESGGQEDRVPDDAGYEYLMRRFERNLIESALENASGNQSEAARRLGISERRLRSRLDILGLRN